MTDYAVNSPPFSIHDEIRAGLIAHCRLSDADIERASEAMSAAGVSFGEAAVRCGVVTQRELDDATGWVLETARRNRQGIVETALLRGAQGRGVVLRHADRVKPDPQLALLRDPYGARSERVRALRTELLLLDESRRDASVLVLLSPNAKEGRSQLVSDLAISFAQLGQRTLLVDADLRRPRLHALFGADNSWGLSQALAFAEPPRLLEIEGIPQLSLMTAGPAAPNPLELLSDGRFGRLLSDWRRSFDYILFDTPPVSEFADALTIASLADRALVISRAAATARRDMKEMLRRLASTQVRILGAVINHF